MIFSVRESLSAALGPLPLHPAVLEPDLDLALGEVERHGDLVPPQPREVITFYELSLQLRDLLPSEGRPLPPGIVVICRQDINVRSLSR